MEDKELKIKEFRTTQAKKKNLMGLNGKFGYILAAIGQPIILHAESGGLFDQTFLESEEESQESDLSGTPEEIMAQIPTADSDLQNPPEGWEWSSDRAMQLFDEQKVGWHFDGLSRGMHLEITYQGTEKNLLVHYKGFLVYKEHSGDLRTYVPHDDWENMIETLYKFSVKILKKRSQLKLINKNKKSQLKKDTWLNKLWNRWGFK